MYALVKDGIVLNVIVWDGISSWTVPEGMSAVEVTAETGEPYIGFAYSDGKFASPPVPIA